MSFDIRQAIPDELSTQLPETPHELPLDRQKIVELMARDDFTIPLASAMREDGGATVFSSWSLSTVRRGHERCAVRSVGARRRVDSWSCTGWGRGSWP